MVENNVRYRYITAVINGMEHYSYHVTLCNGVSNSQAQFTVGMAVMVITAAIFKITAVTRLYALNTLPIF